MRIQALKWIEEGSQWALIMTLFMLPLSITGSDIFINIAVVLSLLQCRREHYLAMLKHPLTPWALSLFVLMMLGTLWSTAPIGMQWTAVLKYIKFAYLIVLFPVIRSKTMMFRAVYAFLLGALIIVLISYGIFLGWIPTKMPADSIFHNHIITSFFVAFAAYVSLYLAAQDRRFCWAYAVLFVLFTLQMFLINQGRTGMAVELVLICLFGFQRFGWKGFVAMSLGAVIFLGVFLELDHQFKNNIHETVSSVADYSENSETSWGFRISFAKFALGLIEQKPVTGFGTGAFYTEFAKTGGLPGWGHYLVTPHDEYLMLASQVGLVGLLLYLIFLGRALWLTQRSSVESRCLAQGLIVTFIIACFCDALFFISATGYFFITMLAVLLGTTALRKEEK